MPYIVKMKAVHEESGLSSYRVAKDLGIQIHTVLNYTKNDEVEVAHVSDAVAMMADYYGYKWHELVEWIDPNADSKDDAEEIKKTLVAEPV